MNICVLFAKLQENYVKMLICSPLEDLTAIIPNDRIGS